LQSSTLSVSQDWSRTYFVVTNHVDSRRSRCDCSTTTTIREKLNLLQIRFAILTYTQIERRDIYETREKKSKMYHWAPFVTGLIVSEIPYLLLCGVLYFVCFYYTVGFPSSSTRAGATLFVMLLYEFIYTGIGQFVAAYAPNAVFASLINPLLIGTLVSFCGVLVPYAQIQEFWRYWIYYL
jgi:ABC-type multidrug transport system permease subunit